MIRSHSCSHRTEQLVLPVSPHTFALCLARRFTKSTGAECCWHASTNLFACAGKQESGLRGAPAKFPLHLKKQRYPSHRMRYSARILAAAGAQTHPSATSKPYFQRMHAHALKPLRSASEPGALLPTAWRIFGVSGHMRRIARLCTNFYYYICMFPASHAPTANCFT